MFSLDEMMLDDSDGNYVNRRQKYMNYGVYLI